MSDLREAVMALVGVVAQACKRGSAALRAAWVLGLACGLACAVGCGTADVEEAKAQPAAAPETAAHPGVPPKRVAATGYFVYEVQRGDTLFALGERLGVPWRELAELNGIERPEELRVGRPLLVPKVEGVKPPQLPARSAEAPAGVRTPVARADLHRGEPGSPFWWPTQGRVVRSFGDKVRGLEEPGIGIAAPEGLEVYAVADGAVITSLPADPSSGSPWGGVVAVSHAGDMVSWYAQLGRVLVAKGATVKKGQAVGTVGVGADGRRGLAFRMYRKDSPVDPLDYLP